MKRFLMRMSTLATVVVLGLIAIAQAQRGADGINPLRSEKREPIPSQTVPTSPQRQERYAKPAQATGSATRGELSATPTRDPFAVLTAGSTEGGTGLPEVSAGVPANVSPTGGKPKESPAAATRYPQLVSPGEPLSALGPAAEDSAGSLTGERYGDASDRTNAVTTSAPGEPARLDLDPNAPVSSLPYSPARSSEGLALPGLGPASDEIGTRIQGTGTPGQKQLEGPQSPQLTIQKFAPDEIQVGKEATFQIKVINTGRIAAHGVEIRDSVPKGTRLVGTDPRALPDGEGGLVWSLGTMQPGDEASVEVRLMPEQEGEIGSVAIVHFNAEASARTIATKPELVIQTSAPSQALIGDEIALTITVSNPGSGVATNVVLEEHVPPGLRHPAGEELEYEVGDLRPKESRQLELTLSADGAGVVTNLLRAHADASLKVEERLEIEVLAPQLDVALDGPKRRYLEREATYTLSVSNPGTAPARNVELVAELPAGFEFVSANNAGYYEPASRTVQWNLEELPVQEVGTVRLTAVPMEAGERVLRFTCTGEPGQSITGEQPILVEGIADVSFQVVDVDDPIERGGETTYEIKVVNQGSEAATNLQLVAMLPPGMQAIAAEGPARHAIDRNRVLFEGLPRLAPKADTTYRVRVQGLQPGDLRFSVQLLTDEMSAPVTKEESTRVYSDE